MSEPALLAAVRDDPDDLAVRLVYADWLEDHGDDARAEFIRTQVELAAPDADAGRAKRLRAREAALLKKHGDAWLAPLFKAVPKEDHLRPRFTRGFVEHLDLPAKWLIEYGGAIRAACPALRSLKVYRAAGWGAALATCPALSGVRELGIPCWVRDNDAWSLSRSPHLGRLRSLTVWLRYEGGNARLCRCLGRSRAWPKLREMTLVWEKQEMADLVDAEAGRNLARTLDPLDRTFHFAPGFSEHFFVGRVPGGHQVLAVLPSERRGGRVHYLQFDAAGDRVAEGMVMMTSRDLLPTKKELAAVKRRKGEGPESCLRRLKKVTLDALHRGFRRRLGAEGADIRVKEFAFQTIEGPSVVGWHGMCASAAELMDTPDDPDEDPEDGEHVLGNGEHVEDWSGDDGMFCFERGPGRGFCTWMEGGRIV